MTRLVISISVAAVLTVAGCADVDGTTGSPETTNSTVGSSLESLAQACRLDVYSACDELWRLSEPDSDEERLGASCNGRIPLENSGGAPFGDCEARYGSVDPDGGDSASACRGHDSAACDQLWQESPVGSDLEFLAASCGSRVNIDVPDDLGAPFGNCVCRFETLPGEAVRVVNIPDDDPDGGLVIRAEPQPDAEFISVIPPGAVATAGGRQSEWVMVCFANQVGWSHGDFLQPADS